MISDLLAPTIDGDRLTEREFKNFFVLLVAAGNDTTRYTMTAGIKALIERPDQLDQLRDAVTSGDDTLVDSGVEEILRWATVTMHFRRTATRDTELGGRRDPRRRQGRHLVRERRLRRCRRSPTRSCSTSAATPTRRSRSGSMSPHLCLGAQLARMEIKILFQELLPRLADARLTGPVERMRSNFIAGVKRLPVEFVLA